MSETSPRSGGEPSLGQLIGKMTETLSALVRDEIQLAQAQLTEKGKAMRTAGAMFGVAAVFGLFGLGWLFHTAFIALSGALPAWAAALIVAVVLLIVAGVAALLGKSKMDNAPTPETKENIQKDIEALKAGVGS